MRQVGRRQVGRRVIIIGVITAFVIVLCVVNVIAAMKFNMDTIEEAGGRFQYIRTEYTSDGERYKLYVDTDTGVMYWNLMGRIHDNGGLTVLLDTDGNPLLWNGETEVD